MAGRSGAHGRQTSMATLSRTRSESWGSGEGVCMCGGAVSPPPSSTGCHGSTSMADPVWVSGGVRSPVGSAPPSPPYPQPFSHPKAILFQPTPRPELTAGMGSAKCVYTTASVRGEGGDQLSPITTHPHALTSCPPQHPCSHHSPRCTRGTPSACLSPFPSRGERGLTPAAPLLVPATRSSPCCCPHRPLGLAAGVRLLELLAKHLHLSTASFINIR